MRRNRRVKIIATLGPASSDPQAIAALFQAGVDVFRINMSHTSHETLGELHSAVRDTERKFGRPIGILCDLQGPKFRLGEFAGGRVILADGATFRFDKSKVPGTQDRVHLPHDQIFDAISSGDLLLLDDGKVHMQVVNCSIDEIEAVVVLGGPLSSRKGIALPDTTLPVSSLTEKDRADLDAALKIGVDWIALSFVQRGDDMREARAIVGNRAALMAKIEKPSAIAHLDDIIDAADGFMVARGDLGVEMPVEKVPGLQKRITREARAAGKPVVIATQMLETMISSPVPTRAEVSDVATAVFDGADAIMLSAESAVGQFPAEAVETMDKIAIEVEQDPSYDAIVHAIPTRRHATGPDAIAAAAHTVAETLKLAAIISYTATGSTCLRVARERPGLPVLALTPVEATSRRMALVWGQHCVLTSDPEDVADMVRKACRIAFQDGFAKPGDGVLITAGVPFGTPGATNMVRIARLNDNGYPLAEGGPEVASE